LACKSCDSRIENSNTDFRDSINVLKVKLKVRQDSIIYRDSVRTKIITRWKVIRHDSLIPCEIKLLVCDTVIQADSSLITQLKADIEVSKYLFNQYEEKISQDSTIINKLTRKVKNRKLIFWTGFVLGASTNLIR
jgi:hypothetical protein